MNNSQLIENTLLEEEEIDVKPMLRARQEKIAKIIEAVDSIAQSEYWRFLEGEVFKALLDSSVNQLCVEKDNQKRDQLQGEIRILSKYADFKGISEAYRLELDRIRKQLK